MSCADAHRPVIARYPRATGANIGADKTTVTFEWWCEVRCSCGFVAPPGVDSDDAVAYHIALMSPVPQ